MNILVLGANGLVGTALRQASAGAPDRYIFSDITAPRGCDTLYLDIADTDAVALICRSEKVDVVLNCAAFGDPAKPLADAALCRQVNAEAPERLAALCREAGMTLVHLSSDAVFGGDVPRPLREDFPVEPRGVYGATRWQGEQAVLASGCRCLVFRTSWLYAPFGRNDMTALLHQMAARPVLQVPFGRMGSPTSALDLASFLLDVVGGRKLDRTGLYHYSAEGLCSRYDFACALRDISASACSIVPGREERYGGPGGGCFIHLDKSRLKETFGVSLPHWYAALKRCYEQSR